MLFKGVVTDEYPNNDYSVDAGRDDSLRDIANREKSVDFYAGQRSRRDGIAGF
ncbi:MAG: hypothetical protein NMNS02_23170 [Nitrosomonas sp.]|nr:MAG: hypothetical protein NMNS02_23170 [Nitrosomonas sp.]